MEVQREKNKLKLNLTDEEIKRITCDKKIKFYSNYGSKEISIELLKKIISCEELFFDDIFEVIINDMENYSKLDIINFIKKCSDSDNNIITLDEKKINILDEQTNFDIFLKNNINCDFNTLIDGKIYNFKVLDFYNFFNLNNDEYLSFVNNNSSDIKCFLYSVLKFLKDNDIFNKYNVSNNVNSIYSDLATYKNVDFEAFNVLNYTVDKSLNQVFINSLLRNKIVDSIPKDYSKLEKSIYIYINMCKTLSYDEEFYACNQQGNVAKYHENINNIRDITPDNNDVVCYEFNSIYGKLLNEFGINYKSFSKDSDEFGGGHANLIFRVDKFLIEADAVTSILRGDLFQAKCNQKLVGLNCINENEATVNEFKNAFLKVYEDLAPDKSNLCGYESYDSIVNQYDVSSDISFKEKLSIFKDRISKCDLSGIDFYSYVLHLRQVLFDSDEIESNFLVTIIKNNKPVNSNKLSTSLAVVTYNIFDMYYDLEFNSYFLADSKTGICDISREDLISNFKDGSYQYIASDKNRIPGIKFGDDLYSQKKKIKV